MDLQEFRAKVASLPVIDTHEHWPPESMALHHAPDFFDMLTPYCVDNLLSAGMPLEEWVLLSNKEYPFDDKWRILSPYLDLVNNTTYFMALEKTLRSHYGFTGYTPASLQEVGRRLADENRAGVYRRIMDRENIESALSFVSMEAPSDFTAHGLWPIPTVSDICPRSRPDVEKLSTTSGVRIHDFDSLLTAVVSMFNKYQEQGVKGIKFGSAYRRTLDFQARTRQEAEAAFLALLSDPYMGDSRVIGTKHTVHAMETLRALDDYLTDKMLELACERNMPVFFHVGIHAWNENSIEATHGAPLNDLIRRHTKTTFILLHCGVPFVDEAILLCKYFSHVYLNMTWLHIINTAQARACVGKFVEMLPLNKIHGFGGDYLYPQQIHGHLAIARNNLAEGLWALAKDGVITPDRALEIARKWLYENPKNLLAL